MEIKIQFDDLQYCDMEVLSRIQDLSEEYIRCDFEYNFYGETVINYVNFNTSLTGTKISDKQTINAYLEYLADRELYLTQLHKEIKTLIEKGQEKFDPNNLGQNAYEITRVWEYVMEAK